MSVDISALRIGDGVTVYATYRGERAGAAKLTITLSGNPVPYQVTVDPKEIATHTPRPLAAGDKVTLSGLVATVLFADAEDTVIRFDNERGIHSGATDGWANLLERQP